MTLLTMRTQYGTLINEEDLIYDNFNGQPCQSKII